MEQRNVGRHATVGALGLGWMGMSEFYGAADDAESIRTIHRALDLGVTMLDTADMYGPFTNEQLIGKAIKGRRGQVFLATKFGIARDPEDPSKRLINGRPEYVRTACDASLKRLGVDHIDLYYQHRVDTSTPIRDGRRNVGPRRCGESALPRAFRSERRKCAPCLCGSSDRRLAKRVVAVVARSRRERPARNRARLGRVDRCVFAARARIFDRCVQESDDFAPDDFRRSSPRFMGENFQRNLDLVHHVQQLAVEKECTTSQLALAWLLAQGRDVIPIPGTKRVKYLEENVGALEVQLTDAELQEINDIFPVGAASGARYTDMSFVNR